MESCNDSVLDIEELTWKDVREEVSEINPAFAEIVDEINPPRNHVLVRAIYPYGSEILKEGVFQLPEKQGGLVSFCDPRFDDRIKGFFAYNSSSNPVAINLKNSVELFFELEDCVIPFSIIRQGKVFGTWRALEGKIQYCPTTFIWGMTAGARSTFLLPKISEAGGYRRLKNQLGIALDQAQGLLDHWRIFKEIANAENFNNPWQTELLYFSRYWFEHKDDKAWARFNYYLYRNAWEGSGYFCNQFVWDLIFSIIQKRVTPKPPAFLLGVIKQLLGIGSGAIVGFRPATDDSLAPVSRLQDVFANVYNLKRSAPIIMQPAYFDLYDPQAKPIYYSLQYPASMEFAPKTNAKTSILSDLYYVRYYLIKYVNEILRGKLNIEMTTLYDAVRTLQCDFFHSEPRKYKEIRDSERIFDEDDSFKKAMGRYTDKDFPKNSSFLNGCIRIAHQNIRKR